MAAEYADIVRSRRSRVDGIWGGGDDRGMAVRVARLESTVEHVQHDIKEIKEDIREFRKEVKQDFQDFRKEVKQDLQDFRKEVKHDIHGLRAEFKQDLHEISKDMRVDFRVLFGALIATALGLAGLMAKGFHWL